MNKQIEEMAFDIIKATSPLGVKDLTKQFDYKEVATDLYELYGWRKQSEVARKFFAEIDDLLTRCRVGNYGGHFYSMAMNEEYAELKKKYTKSEETE